MQPVTVCIMLSLVCELCSQHESNVVWVDIIESEQPYLCL